jgi:hypothetical protein
VALFNHAKALRGSPLVLSADCTVETNDESTPDEKSKLPSGMYITLSEVFAINQLTL